MSPLLKKNKFSLFLTFEQGIEFCKESYGLDIKIEDICLLIEKSILPMFQLGSDKLVLRDDLISVLPVLSNMSASNDNKFHGDGWFWDGFSDGIILSPNTRIDLVDSKIKIEPAFYPALRNLISAVNLFENGNSEVAASLSYFSPIRVLTTSKKVREYIDKQRERANAVVATKASQFANSAYYMGSKRSLVGFLIEAISSVLPDDGLIVDLMCGSGAASGAFSKVWRTLASDAQEFCQILAVIQGGGFSAQEAECLLEHILPLARNHAHALRERLNTYLIFEDKIFHGDIGFESLEEYRDFIDRFPTYPSANSYESWDPAEEVEKRKRNPKFYPYCLFTTYFANIYFGLRQCVEIDSLRYAIDQIENKNARLWALGALVATLSAMGTTYAGHFAQPLIRRTEDLSVKNLSEILERRAYSIIHEFSIRLLNLSEESEKSPRQIKTIPGPWPNALISLDNLICDETVVVYIDAPYKREEYSRYYHVLETAVAYSYPSSIGSGKTPDKNRGERFQSEFFTRSKLKLKETFVKLIIEILDRNWICSWSYSNSGDANLAAVIDEVYKARHCNIKSYAVPYEHKAQGGKKTKKVIEYLILFIPKNL